MNIGLKDSVLWEASNRMAFGRPVSSEEFRPLSGFLDEIKRFMFEKSELREELKFLYELSDRNPFYVSIRTEERSVYMVALFQPNKFSDKVVLEPVSEKGHASYIFKLGRDVSINTILKALVYSGFRREPIYLSLKELSDPENSLYLHALKWLPYLNVVRGSFMGRVIHREFSEWKKRMEKLIMS